MRWASRTHEKVGLTFASRLVASLRPVSPMPRDARHAAREHAVLAHQLDVDRRADADARQLGLLEIALDPDGVAVDQRHDPAARGDVGARTQLHVGDPAVDRGPHRRAFQVELGEVAVGQGLLVGRLGGQVGGLGGLDLLLRDGRVGELAVAGIVGGSLLGGGLAALHHRLRLPQPDAEPVRIDAEQDVALPHDLIVLHQHLGDEAGHVGGHRHDVGAHAPVPGPGGIHVVIPQAEADDQRRGDHAEGDQEAAEDGEQGGHCRVRWARVTTPPSRTT